MMYLRYSGEFLSIAGVTWRCEIWQDAESDFDAVGDLRFLSGSEVEIEWSQKDKEEVICGSVATVTLLSPGDRTYTGMYTIAPGKIRLDIYREGTLYWCGCLDPEFYEEPYAYGDRYAVSLTFSDFGIFDRLKYNLSGLKTVRAVIEDALNRGGLSQLSLSCERVSTYVNGLAATPLLDALAVRSENWTDDAGDESSMAEVIEGMLRPLALKMVQKAGKVHIYDINGLYNGYESEEIEWDLQDQTLGTDKVANNVKVIFSPYAGDSLIDGDDLFDTSGDTEDKTNLTNSGTYFTFYKGLSSGVADTQNLSFTIFTCGGSYAASQGKSKLPYVNPLAGYFHILPLLDGEENEGVYEFFTTGSEKISGGASSRHPSSKYSVETLFSTPKVYLPDLSQSSGRKPLLKVTMEMLMDAKYNPFESEDVMDGTDEMTEFESIAYARIPVRISLYDESGNEIYHYRNADVLNSALTNATLSAALGEWEAGSSVPADASLMYYGSNFEKGEAVGGWKANRQAVHAMSTLAPSFVNLDDGQFIPYPPAGGYLQISVITDKTVFQGSTSGGNPVEVTSDNADKFLRWTLYKVPSVELVNNDILHGAVTSDDIEYSGVLNEDAKDSLEIDTVCGTMPTVNPSAKGLYYRSDGPLVEKMIRAGRAARPEQLLIGSMYSQFADRKTVLSGTARILPDGLKWYTDAALDGVQLMLLGEVQNLRKDESKITAAEFRPDEYKSTGE